LLKHKAILLGAVLRARSFDQWRIGHKFNKIGRNCNIHPTAWIEFSDIGDNATIGSGSVVSLSIVGDNCWLGDNTTLEGSVLGDLCWVLSGAVIRYALLYPGVVSVARFVNMATCGRDAFLGDGVTLSEYRIDGRNVSVMKKGHPVDTGFPAIGACLGHGVYLGAGSVVAPCRAIPNCTHLSPERSRHIAAFGADGSLPGYRPISVAPGCRPRIEPAEKKEATVSLLRRLLRLPSVD
jgi:acetyltransferase-like isoleucine patch superfamily enzyme